VISSANAVFTPWVESAATVAAPHLSNLASASSQTLTPISNSAIIAAAVYHGQMAPHYATFQEQTKDSVDNVNQNVVPVVANSSTALAEIFYDTGGWAGGSQALSEACSNVSSRASAAQNWLNPRLARANMLVAPYASRVSQHLSVVDFSPNLAMGELSTDMTRAGVEQAIVATSDIIPRNLRIRHTSGYTRRRVAIWRKHGLRATRERLDEKTTSFSNLFVE